MAMRLFCVFAFFSECVWYTPAGAHQLTAVEDRFVGGGRCCWRWLLLPTVLSSSCWRCWRNSGRRLKGVCLSVCGDGTTLKWALSWLCHSSGRPVLVCVLARLLLLLLIVLVLVASADFSSPVWSTNGKCVGVYVRLGGGTGDSSHLPLFSAN